MIDIIWPYKLTDADKSNGFFSLKYSVNSATMNFKDLGQKWVMSAEDPGVDANWYLAPDVGMTKDEKIVNKVLMACDDPKISDPFIYSCDDMYFLKETRLKALNHAVALQNIESPSPSRFKHQWVKLLHKTLLKLKTEGYPHWNYSTHIPYVIHKDKFKHAVAVMGANNQICSMYHNVNYEKPDLLLKDTRLKAGFYSPKTYIDICNKIDAKYILNHDDVGLSPGLKQFIEEQFS